MSLSWHRGADRPRTEGEGRVTAHSLSFGAHYDPRNVAYAGLLAHNDDALAPGAGYPDHPHRDVEIVTWVVGGLLLHRDAVGGSADLAAGAVQVQSAGSGIVHAEIADPASGPTRFVQAWVRPDVSGVRPRRVVGEGPARGDGLVPVVGGASALPVGAAGATLWAARLGAGDEVVLPGDPRQHVFVTRGALSLAGHTLRDGDAARIDDEPGHRVRAEEETELTVWAFA